ncbi:MAG: OstA-like protein, partial [Pseudomonadales bacterium]
MGATSDKDNFYLFLRVQMMMRSPLFIVFLLVFLVSTEALSQRRVKLKRADNLVGSVKDGKRYDRLLGNVIFVQNKTTIYCDSAHYLKSENR